MTDVSIAFDLRLELGESPVWDSAQERLLVVDIHQGAVHELDPVSGRSRVFRVGRPVGAVALATAGARVLAAGVGFYRLDPETGDTRLITNVTDRDDVRMNDGNVDARGRFWAGTMSLAGVPEQGALYRLDPAGHAEQVLAPVTTSNGIDWSPDNTRMYYADTRTGRVDVFDFDVREGAVSNRRPFATIPPDKGRPDGLIVDDAGGVWVALWAGGAVHRYAPGGRLDLVIELPVKYVTKCAFGGPDLEDLYITTASNKLTPEERVAQPHAGSVFHAKPGFQGRPANLFQG